MDSMVRIILLIVCLLISIQVSVFSQTVIPSSSSRWVVLDQEDTDILSINMLGFGPRYAWTSCGKPQLTREAETTTYSYTFNKLDIAFSIGMKPDGSSLVMDINAASPKAQEITYVGITFDPGSALAGGNAVFYAGETEIKTMPIRLGKLSGDNITKIMFNSKEGVSLATATFSSPVDLHIDGNARMKILQGNLTEGQKASVSVTLAMNGPVTFYSSLKDVPQATDHSTWFPFKPKNTTEPGALGMNDWLSIPEKQLTLEKEKVMKDGKPFKAWGTNVEYSAVAPRTKEDAVKRAAWFAKWGVNCIRMHKLTNPGWEGLGSRTSASVYDSTAMERFDVFLSELRKNGVIYGFSPVWDLMVFEGDKEKLLAYDEMVKANKRKPTTQGLIWFAEDVQDLHIETMLNLLNHENPHTGLKYAVDPALAYFELQNEDSAMFYTFISWIVKLPTYHKLLAEKFSKWLKAKYETHDALVLAWGQGALNSFSKGEGAFPNEHLDKLNITPCGNPWFFDNRMKDHAQKKRLQDTTRFLYECQREYFSKAIKAIRKTGYTGPIVTGNWQAGSTTGHFLNLASDAEFGIVDRHNYQGGAKGNPAHEMRDGFKFHNLTMLSDPGSGLLSVGMQQVYDRPFMYSEWEAVLPSEFGAADTAIVAAYGFGLQGWDMSFNFASNHTGFTRALSATRKKFNNLVPQGIGIFPILGRMVIRGDITEAPPVAVRRLTIDQAVEQTYDFEHTTVMSHDHKSFSGTPHHNALAAGKVTVDFVTEAEASTINDWKAEFQTEGKTIISNTGQLSWTPGDTPSSGYVSINTKGTQGVLGFAQGKAFDLGDLTLKINSPYAVIMATAKSQTGTLKSDTSVLVCALARVHNTDMNLSNSLIYSMGNGPMILEPVKADITFKRPTGKVTILDHDGMPTDKTYVLTEGTFTIDTEKDKTMYYLVEFE